MSHFLRKIIMRLSPKLVKIAENKDHNIDACFFIIFPPHWGGFISFLTVQLQLHTNYNSLTSDVGGSLLPRLSE
jgi:hypothetical protein